MQLIQRTPWDLMANLRRDVDRVFEGENRARFVPAVDIQEEAERYVVLADLPGVDAAAIEITVDKDILTIKGERQVAPVADEATVQRAERARGAFERHFRLPETAASEGFQADYRNGVLTVSIPKAEQATPYRIEVTAN